MIFNLDKHDLSDRNKQYDFCIIGSGAAGITIANKLNKKYAEKIIMMK